MGSKASGRIEDFLRPPRIAWMRSAYAIEVTPWAKRDQIEAALFFRGAIVSAHGYIETRMAELALRSSVMPEYLGLRAKFPYSHGSRLSYLRQIFEKEPLRPYRETAEKFFTRFDNGAEFRHLVAHARMQVPSDWYVVLEDFHTSEGDAIKYRRKPFTLSELEGKAWEAVCLSRICQRLADALEQLKILPQLEQLAL